ncbi:FCD domain-containing protein [Paraclostridium bifermentans]|nr:FCD domain-containing protein [Paraclostridium bifermentans]
MKEILFVIKIETSLMQPLSMMFTLNNGDYKDIIELRQMIELEAVKLAAIRATEEELEELKMISQRLTKKMKFITKAKLIKKSIIKLLA